MATARDDLYHQDWYRWARQQAGGLRRLADERINTDVELQRIAEDLDEMADGRLEALRSQLRRIIVHLLKLEHSPALEPRRQWRGSVRDARVQIEDRLTAVLEAELRESLSAQYRKARRLAAGELMDYGEIEAARSLPAECPYSFEQVLDHDWLPEGPGDEPVG
jgi:hypothetical protein